MNFNIHIIYKYYKAANYGLGSGSKNILQSLEGLGAANVEIIVVHFPYLNSLAMK